MTTFQGGQVKPWTTCEERSPATLTESVQWVMDTSVYTHLHGVGDGVCAAFGEVVLGVLRYRSHPRAASTGDRAGWRKPLS